MPSLTYNRGAMIFHWLIAGLILLASGLALFRESFEPWSVEMIGAHKIVGLTILALSLARLAWRLAHRPPPLPDYLGRAERILALASHCLLYVFMVGVPLAGWTFVSLAPDSRPTSFRGPDSVPELPFAQNDALAFRVHEMHEIMGFALLALIGLHVAAALRHQIRQPTYIRRMVARRRAIEALALLAVALAGLWAIGLALDLTGFRLV